eukprot:1875767-Amphidinium_carterae.1
MMVLAISVAISIVKGFFATGDGVSVIDVAYGCLSAHVVVNHSHVVQPVAVPITRFVPALMVISFSFVVFFPVSYRSFYFQSDVAVMS